MSSYVLMRLLESAPSRYDRGLRILTLGRLEKAYDRLASHVVEGQKVLDIGCGTGALALRAAQRGAWVRGIDVNAQMLEIAQHRAEEAGLADTVEVREIGVVELANEEPETYDVAMSGLCFSELTDDELAFTLKQVLRILRPGGLLLVADEVKPAALWKRLLHALARFPLAVVAYLITQTTTSAVGNLPGMLEEAGLVVESSRLNWLESFIELTARKPREGLG